jgi:hypothetical protein
VEGPVKLRYRQGEVARLTFCCTTAARVATQPDAPPAIAVYSAAGAKLATGRMALADRYRQAGLVRYQLQLGSDFPAGHYLVRVDYAVAGVARAFSGVFEVTAGDAAGAVVSKAAYERPHARFLVHQTEDGTRVFGRNPSV